MLATLVVLALVAAAFVAIAQPRLVVGEPLGKGATGRFLEKPDPPKASGEGGVARAPAVDLVAGAPAEVSIAPTDDPRVQSLLPGLTQALIRSGDAGTSGVQVIDGDGRVVFDFNGGTPLIPASTSKLFTAAAALATFGPDHQFVTTLSAATLATADGTIPGDLILIGGGDPTLVSDAYIAAEVDMDRPATPISALADQVVAAGITRIQGAIVGDGSYLDGDPLAQGWPPRYLEELDTSPIGGLMVDEGLDLYLDEAGMIRARASVDPAGDAARALTAALIQRGVAVDGTPVSLVPPVDGVAVQGPVSRPVVELGQVQSPPVSVLLRTMVQTSDNTIADTIFRAVGRRLDGTGTFGDGAAQGRQVLEELALDWTAVSLQDGSGLSRDTAISPAVMTALNVRMTNSRVGAAWQDLMAVSGESGTLRRRLVGSIAELRLRGKTGSLGDVGALTGAVVGPDGLPLYFTVISNGLEGPQVDAARRLQDLVVLALAAELYGCTEIEIDDPPVLEPGEFPPLPLHTCN